MEDAKMMSTLLQQPYKIFKADSGTFTFTMIFRSFVTHMRSTICLIDKECPHSILYKIKIDFGTGYISLVKELEEKKVVIPPYINPNVVKKYWLSWYNDTIQLGIIEPTGCQRPFLQYSAFMRLDSKRILIGFIGFSVDRHIDWLVESSTVPLKPIRLNSIDSGQLKWVKMVNDELPQDALIGGFENEPIYIARSHHNSSLCPGKYVPSKKAAFVAWGGYEHIKTDFEILCGFDAVWIKCKDKFIPENVFIAGRSEVRNEALYIGRARIDDDLVLGKVHLLYKTCYLPYRGHEVERPLYEVLVRGDVPTCGVTGVSYCTLNPLKALQPCRFDF